MARPLKTQAEAKEEHEAAEALRKRAARQAAQVLAAPEEVPTVECTVLPMADGKISMGQHVGGLGEAHYEEGEKFTVALPVALSLYRRGYVVFENAKQIDAEQTAKEDAAALKKLEAMKLAAARAELEEAKRLAGQ